MPEFGPWDAWPKLANYVHDVVGHTIMVGVQEACEWQLAGPKLPRFHEGSILFVLRRSDRRAFAASFIFDFYMVVHVR